MISSLGVPWEGIFTGHESSLHSSSNCLERQTYRTFVSTIYVTALPRCTDGSASQGGAVQEILGHSQVSMTMAIYSHVLPTMQREALSKLNDALQG